MNPDTEILDLVALAESVKIQLQSRLGPQAAPLVDPIGRLGRRLLALRTAMRAAPAEAPTRRKKPPSDSFDEKYEGTFGTSPHLEALRRTILRVAGRNVPVLIQGESGTGKELLARVVHALSDRHAKPFLAINCGAFPSSLLESELFGHAAGAFTGARSDRRGVFQAADGGTLFLDEVGELPAEAQSRFLRVLQSGEIQKVGSDRVERVDVRIVAATNRQLREEVSAGRFRLDLYFRLTVVPVHLPPLRERRDEIAVLVDHFLERFRVELDRPEVRGLSKAAMEYLATQEFPGNIRELENMVKRGVLLAEGDRIEVRDLEVADGAIPASPPVGTPVAVPRTADELREAREALVDRLERAFLLDALTRARGRVSDASRLTGMNRTQFHQMLRRRGIDHTRFRIGGEEDEA